MPTQSVVAGKKPNQISTPQSTIVTKALRVTVRVITWKGRESGEPVPVQVASQTQRSEFSISFARRMDRPWPARLYFPKQVAFVSPRHSRRYAYSTTSVARAVYRSYGCSGQCLLGHRDEDRAHPSRCSSVDNRQHHKPRRAVLVITRKDRESGEPDPIPVSSQLSEISIFLRQTYELTIARKVLLS